MSTYIYICLITSFWKIFAHLSTEASQSPVDALPASPTGHHDAMGAALGSIPKRKTLHALHIPCQGALVD